MQTRKLTQYGRKIFLILFFGLLFGAPVLRAQLTSGDIGGTVPTIF